MFLLKRFMFFISVTLSHGVTAAEAEKILPMDPLSASSIGNMVMGLGLVLVLIFAMAWLVRRMGGMQIAGSQRIRMIAGLSLGPREKVVLIQVENKRLLLGVAQGQVNKLHELDGDFDPIKSTSKPSASDFKGMFLQALNKSVKK